MEITKKQVEQRYDLMVVRTCKIARIVFASLFILSLLVIAVSLFAFLATLSGAFPVLENGLDAGAVVPLATIVQGTLISASFFLAYLICSDTARGGAVFSGYQAKRVKMISWLLVLYVAIDIAACSGAVSFAHDDLVFGVSHATAPFFGANIGLVGIVVLMFFLAKLFEYSSLLQRVSDDTI